MTLSEAIRHFQKPERELTDEENRAVADMLVHLRFHMNWRRVLEAYLHDHPETGYTDCELDREE